jgi:L-lactate dehydrogenase complex protein LldG
VSAAARAEILARLRRGLGRQDATADDQARTVAEARIRTPTPPLIPTRADLDLEGRISLFTHMAETVSARVERLAHYANVADVVVAHLREHNLPMRLVAAADPLLERVPFDRELLAIRTGAAEDGDEVSLTRAFAGIAETGTLMLTSTAATPTMLNYLPDDSIVVLPSNRVLRAYEDGWQLLHAEQGSLPRSINFVTGPSRTGDIEQKILLGAHGPRRLLILLVDEPAEASLA